MTDKLFENPCGGCGEKYSNKRCLGCMHEMPPRVIPMTSDRVSNERLAEMLAGLEGVTPGPWKYEGSIYEHMGAGLRSLPDDRGFAQLWKSGAVAIDAAHIARCDPDTMRSIITELQHLRSPVTVSDGEVDFAKHIAAAIKAATEDGAACGWTPCSGCYETEDGYPVGTYPHSKMFGCDVGSGCDECGGLGVTWEYWSTKDLAEMAREPAITAALAPAEQEGENAKHQDESADRDGKLRRDLAELRAIRTPTHPGGDSRDVVARLREYAKDWRTRAASADVVDEAADIIEAVERELRDWQNGHANSVRAHAAAITRAETAEASLAAAEDKVTALSDLLVRAQLNVSEIYENWHSDTRAALAGSNGNG